MQNAQLLEIPHTLILRQNSDVAKFFCSVGRSSLYDTRTQTELKDSEKKKEKKCWVISYIENDCLRNPFSRSYPSYHKF